MTKPPPPARRSLPPFTLLLLALAGCGGSSSNLFGGIELPGEDEEEEPGGGLIDAFDLAYPTDFLFAEVGLPLAPQVPIASTQVLSYASDPPLPAGLVLDPVTGVLAGSATERATLATYRIVGTSATGTAEFELDLAVAGPSRYALVANRGDDTLSLYALGRDDRALQPAGYEPLTPFEVTPVQLRAHPEREFVFALNAGTNTLSSIRVDVHDGALASAHAISIGAGPHDLDVHPEGRFLYLASRTAGTLRTYQFDPLGGTVAQIGETLNVFEEPLAVRVAPNGSYVVVAHADGRLQSFVLEPTSGQPIFSSELVLFEGALTSRPAISHDSAHLYVTLPDFASLVRVGVDPATGFLTLDETTRETELAPSAVFLSPDGLRAFVFNDDSEVTRTPSVSVYDIDPTTGAPSEAVHHEFPFVPVAIDLAPDGRSFVLVDEALPGPRRFEVLASTGALLEGGAARARIAPGPVLVLDGDTELERRVLNVYVANRQFGDITVLAAAEDGTLAPLGPPTPGGTRAADLAVDPHRRFLWLANDTPGKASVITYALTDAGQLAPVAERLFGVPPTSIAVEPSGRFVYVTTDAEENGVFSFHVEDDGALTTLAFHPVGNSPAAVEADPTGRFLYVVNSGAEQPGDQGSLASFSIDVATGELTPVLPDAFAGGRPLNLAFSSDSTRAYSAFANTDLVTPYLIDVESGALELQLIASMTANEPTDLALSPDGRFAWLTARDSPGSGRIELFDVRADDGALFDAQSGELEAREFFTGGSNPIAVEVDPSGALLYVLHAGSAGVTTFGVDPANGELFQLDSDPTGPAPVAFAASVGTP